MAVLLDANLSFRQLTAIGGPGPCTAVGERHGKSINRNATIESFERAIVPAVRVVEVTSPLLRYVCFLLFAIPLHAARRAKAAAPRLLRQPWS